MQVKTIDVLRRAKKLMRNVKTWTSGSNARTWSNEPVYYFDRRAAKFCAYGACLKSAHEMGLKGFNSMLHWDQFVESMDRLAQRRTGQQSLIDVNDNIGREAALQVIDDAIAELEAQGY